MSTIFDTRISYTVGGVVWTFSTPFSAPPTICVGVQLSNLADSIYPLSAKIVSSTTAAVVIKVYKVILTNISELLFGECEANDVVVHITAEGE